MHIEISYITYSSTYVCTYKNIFKYICGIVFYKVPEWTLANIFT